MREVKLRTEPIPDSEVVSMVRSGGGEALTAMGHLLYRHRTYPGDISDVYALLEDNEPISFGCTPSDAAWAYLDVHGLEKYRGTRWQVIELMKDDSAAPDGMP